MLRFEETKEVQELMDGLGLMGPELRTRDELRPLVESFPGRRQYIEKYGYILISREFKQELKDALSIFGIKNFIEIEAGVGTLTKVLNDSGFTGVGLTLEIEDKHWGMTVSDMYQHCVSNNLLTFQDIRETRVQLPELVVSSWIPYEGGEEVIEFFENNGLPDYYMVIGEERQGCTSNNEFFDFLDENFNVKYHAEEYVTFDGIYDRCIIYEKKEKA